MRMYHTRLGDDCRTGAASTDEFNCIAFEHVGQKMMSMQKLCGCKYSSANLPNFNY